MSVRNEYATGRGAAAAYWSTSHACAPVAATSVDGPPPPSASRFTTAPISLAQGCCATNAVDPYRGAGSSPSVKSRITSLRRSRSATIALAASSSTATEAVSSFAPGVAGTVS